MDRIALTGSAEMQSRIQSGLLSKFSEILAATDDGTVAWGKLRAYADQMIGLLYDQSIVSKHLFYVCNQLDTSFDGDVADISDQFLLDGIAGAVNTFAGIQPGDELLLRSTQAASFTPPVPVEVVVATNDLDNALDALRAYVLLESPTVEETSEALSLTSAALLQFSQIPSTNLPQLDATISAIRVLSRVSQITFGMVSQIQAQLNSGQ